MNVVKETYAHPMLIVKIHQEAIIVLANLVFLGMVLIVKVNFF